MKHFEDFEIEYDCPYNFSKKAFIDMIRIRNVVSGEEVTVNALWDTGTSTSGISERITDFLGLQWRRTVRAKGVNGESELSTFVAVAFPGCHCFGTIVEAMQINTPGVDFIIGLDIILKGRFRIESDAIHRHVLYFKPDLDKFIDFSEENTAHVLKALDVLGMGDIAAQIK